MTGNAARRLHGRPLPDGPAPFTTLVELTFDKRKVERWIRFGRKSYEQIIDRRRSVVGFAPECVFAFVRWASNDFGTIVSRTRHGDFTYRHRARHRPRRAVPDAALRAARR